MSKLFTVAVMTALILVSFGTLTKAEVYVFRDPIRFDLLTQAPAVPIPDATTVFPNNSCGSAVGGQLQSGPQMELGFGASNKVTISTPQGNGLCLFDGGSLILPVGNTEPSFMTANTIVGWGYDDFRLVFLNPVQAVAFWLLTNNAAHEVATLKDAAGNIIDTIDIDRFTPRNDRAFVGFISRTPIHEIVLDTNAGNPTQNEGIQAIKIAETVAIPRKLSSDE